VRANSFFKISGYLSLFFPLKKILERDFLFFDKYAGDNKPFVARQKNERIKINIHYIFLIQ
jgi:hypothetical protein